jgi:hypothetical protein
MRRAENDQSGSRLQAGPGLNQPEGSQEAAAKSAVKPALLMRRV